MPNPPRYFVILGAMRTGSNLLEKTLEQLGDTDCYGEAFNPGFISGPRKRSVLGHTVQKRDEDPLGFLERMITARPKKIAGFRLFADHDRQVIEQVLRDPRCARIILTRDPVDSYISLKIAQKTDQWMLRNPRRRIQTQIHFDPVSFQRYAARLHDHYAWIDAQLVAHGTEAFHIGYADLANPSQLQGVASWIGSSGTIPTTAPILRQNPDSRAAKVENYAEMCEALGLASEEDDCQRIAGTQDFVPRPLWPSEFPFVYAPVFGPAFEPMIALLHRIEVRDLKRPKIAAPDLSDRATRSVLYTQEAPSGTQLISMVTHPFTRLHSAFAAEMFGNGWQFSDLRRALIRSHGPMPPPKALTRSLADYSADRQCKHFSGFLDAIAAALGGADSVHLRAEWRPQTDLLNDQAERVAIDRVFRHEAFAEAVDWVTDRMSLPQFPPGQIKGMAQTGRQKLLDIANVATPELTQKAMDLHRIDYDRFDYGQLPPEI